MPAAAGTHAPGRSEQVEGLRGDLGDHIITIVVVGVKGKDTATAVMLDS